MSSLLIRNVEPDLKRKIEERARAHRRSLTDEVKTLIRKGLAEVRDDRKLGTLLFESVRPEDRGNDLVFEVPGDVMSPPEFE